MGRYDIKVAVKKLLEDLDIFYRIYIEPTDIEKEKSFPIAWIYLGPENTIDGELTKTNYMRSVSLEITIGVKHLSTDSPDMDLLLDKVYNMLKSNYTLNGTVINLTPTNLTTDQGMFHPYSLASLNYTVLIR